MGLFDKLFAPPLMDFDNNEGDYDEEREDLEDEISDDLDDLILLDYLLDF